MIITPTEFPDLYILEPRIFGDDRGFFYESYNKSELLNQGIEYNFVQDNHSRSVRGVLRGLHYQKGDAAQTKLVRVTNGTVIDVVVDIRQGSPMFLKHFAIELSAENNKQLLIPKGFAHGYVVISDTAEFLYKCDAYYNPSAEGGIYFADPALKIDWRMTEQDYIVSEKDKENPNLKDADFHFPFKEYSSKG